MPRLLPIYPTLVSSLLLSGHLATAQDIDLGSVPLSGEIIFIEEATGEVVEGAKTAISFSSSSVLSGDFIGADQRVHGVDEFELMSLLQNQSIRDEIELVEGQYEKMRKRNEEIKAKLNEVASSLMKGQNGTFKLTPEALKKIAERQTELQQNAKADLEDMLLPHQIKRLRQVAFQNQMNRFGAAEALTSGTLAEKLGLSDEQKELLKEKSIEIERRVKKEVAKIRADAKQELYRVLDASQRAMLNELVGEHFQREEPKASLLRELLSRRPGSRKTRDSAREIPPRSN